MNKFKDGTVEYYEKIRSYIKPKSLILDYGSGRGSWFYNDNDKKRRNLRDLRHKESTVIGVDIDDAVLTNPTNHENYILTDEWVRENARMFDLISADFVLEHLDDKKKFYSNINTLLKDDGVSLIHTIGSVNPPRDPHPWITKYIFPGGYTPSLSEVTTPIEKAGLIVADIEVLRLHYSHTLRHWKENCIRNKDKIIQMFDERFFRMWEFYLAGCEMAFKWGDQVVYQFQLTKNYSSTPVTRDYIYQ